jgi:hypothetical protein
MYKVEGNLDFLKPYHKFMCDILKALRKSKREDISYSKDDLAENLMIVNQNFRSFINRGNFLDNIYELKNSPLNLCKEYGSFVRKYKSILNGKWKGESELLLPANDVIKKIFIFFYEDLLEYITFNKALFHSSSSLTDFRAMMALNQVCPYCDMNKINKELVSIDHFLPKSKFPILSIYPENLIVSCKACNETVKGENILVPISHPYYDSVSDYFVFEINDMDIQQYKIKVIMNEGNTIFINEKVKNFLELFNIKERYEKNMTAELKDLRDSIRKKAIAELNGIALFRGVTLQDIEVSIERYFRDSLIDNKKLHRAVDGSKIKNDYLNQIIETKDFQSDIEYLESYFLGLESLLKN